MKPARTVLLCITPATGVVRRYERVPGTWRPSLLDDAKVTDAVRMGHIMPELEDFRQKGTA